jgi:YebC/PmpR family DNA-binding regulatory protein
MSGHSKWHSIRHQKGVVDARRGKLFTKLTKEIIIAVREGGSNPETNSRLRLAIQKAKDNSMPNDNIERAIKRGSGTLEGGDLQELTLEGYAPGGIAVLVSAMSDNRNRTVQEVRHIFLRGGGSLGESGSVMWQFEMKGILLVKSEGFDTDELALQAIDAGADDVKIEPGYIELHTSPTGLEEVRMHLEKSGFEICSAETRFEPKMLVEINEHVANQVLRLLDKIDELDDVQQVSSNADFPVEVLERFQEAKN